MHAWVFEIQDQNKWSCYIKWQRDMTPHLSSHGIAHLLVEKRNITIMCCVELLSHVWIFVTPWTVAHQASLSLGIHRQEYWSGLPCPSPGDLLNPGIKPRCPSLQAEPLLSEAQGKPKNIEVGNLSVLQGIFLTQELNWGLLYCRQILSQLSHQGRP